MSLKIFISGDVLSSQKSDFIDDNLKKIIQNCDFSICNFEAPIETEGMLPIKKAGPHTKQDPSTIPFLKESGFNIFSLANNHIYDYGQKALQNTIENISKNEIRFVGAGLNFKQAYEPLILEKNGMKIAVVSVCENEFGCLYEDQERGGYAWIFSDIIEDNIRELKEKSDFVIVIAHAGVEDISLPLKEWRNKYKRFCEIGADIVIGHHPHVPQGYEKHGNSFIFYSLGNFYFENAEKISNNESYSVVLNLDIQKQINTEIIYHKKINSKVTLSEKENVNFNLDQLNDMLKNNYDKNINDLCVDLFKKYYFNYYEVALGKKNKLRNLIKKMLFKNSNKSSENMLLLHNIRIESHRFLVQRALSILNE